MSDKTDWIALIVALIAIPTAFMFGGVWVGLATLVIGSVVLGWSKRHEGPFPTDKEG